MWFKLDLWGLQPKLDFLFVIVSAIDRCKRVLVSLLKTLAGIYSVTVNVTRESSDKDVSPAFRKLLRKTDPRDFVAGSRRSKRGLVL